MPTWHGTLTLTNFIKNNKWSDKKAFNELSSIMIMVTLISSFQVFLVNLFSLINHEGKFNEVQIF